MPKCFLARRGLLLPLFAVCCCVSVVAQAERVARLEEPNVSRNENSSVVEASPLVGSASAQKLLSRFLVAEQRVREELNAHTFKRDVVLQTIGPNGEVTGEYIRNSVFVFDDRGNRIERVLFHPRSTIRELKITKEDIQDLAGAQLLGIDIHEANKYLLKLSGEEVVNGREAYVIDVTPKQPPNPHRMRERSFVGRMWLDAATLQVFKVRGIVEPHGKQRFPIFETWRQPATGSLLFPERAEADDILLFPNQAPVHYRVRVRYYGYKRFASTVKLTEVDQP